MEVKIALLNTAYKELSEKIFAFFNQSDKWYEAYRKSDQLCESISGIELFSIVLSPYGYPEMSVFIGMEIIISVTW